MVDSDLIHRLGETRKYHIDSLVRLGGFAFSETFFLYTSGEIGPYFVNSDVVSTEGGDYRKAVDDMGGLVCEKMRGKDYQVVSGGESRDWIFSLPLANALWKSIAMLYKDGRFVGADVNGKKVIHVADINNEGSSLEKWVKMIREKGGIIEDVFFYVDRMEGGVNIAEELGLNRHALVELDEDAWTYLKQSNVVLEGIYSQIMFRKKTLRKWGEEMLKSEQGIARLVELWNKDEREQSKLRKLLENYSSLQSYLIEALKREGIEVDLQ